MQDDTEGVNQAEVAEIWIKVGKSDQPEPKDSREVLEILTQYAETGLKLLKQQWEGKVGIQIQNDVRKIIGA